MCDRCTKLLSVNDQLEAALIDARVEVAMAKAKVEVYEDSLLDIIEELQEARRVVTPGL